MQFILIRDDVVGRHFRDRPEVLDFIEENKVVEPWTEGLDYDMRVIPGDRRDLMALPAASIDGRTDEPWFIDLRLDALEFGAIYIGRTLFHHLANLVGYCEVDELRSAIRRNEVLDAECVRLRQLINRFDVLRDDMDDLHDAKASVAPAESGRGPKTRVVVTDRQAPSSTFKPQREGSLPNK